MTYITFSIQYFYTRGKRFLFPTKGIGPLPCRPLLTKRATSAAVEKVLVTC